MPEPSNSQRALTGTMSPKDQGQHQAVQDSRLASDRIVTDEEMRSALRFLRDHAKDIGQARERMVNATNKLKRLEAILFLASEQKSAEARKADARASEKWEAAATEEAVAAGEYEKARSLREAAIAMTEAWRTEQATLRGIK